MLKVIRKFIHSVKKHWRALKKDINAYMEVHRYARYMKYNKKELQLYAKWPVIDTRNKAKVMYQKELAEKLRYEIEEEIKKEKKDAIV